MEKTTPAKIETTHSLESTLTVIFENKDEKKKEIFIQKVFDELCLIDNNYYLEENEPLNYFKKSQTTFNFDIVEENYIIHKGVAFVNCIEDLFPSYKDIEIGSHIISLGHKYEKNGHVIYDKPKVYSRGKDWWLCHNNKCDLFLNHDILDFKFIEKEA